VALTHGLVADLRVPSKAAIASAWPIIIGLTRFHLNAFSTPFRRKPGLYGEQQAFQDK
jgi:hypothetical protein